MTISHESVESLASHEALPVEHTEQHTENETPSTTVLVSTAILFMLFLLLINELAVNYLKKIQRDNPIFKYLNNTMLTTSIGLGAGYLLKLGMDASLTENLKQSFSDIFLIVLLPPIIFESAINMESQLFFKHFGTILMFAIPGTFISTGVTGLGLYYLPKFGIDLHLGLTACFAFGSLISATDPVAVLNIFKSLNANKMLYIIIFGESILNDAIAIIFYETAIEIYHSVDMGLVDGIRQFLHIFGGSMGVGFGIGLVCAAILKSEKRHSRHEVDSIETIIAVTIPWISYLLAQLNALSGIVSIMFCGISMARYALPNLSEHGQHLMHLLYHALGYAFENCTFLFMGIVFATFELAWEQNQIIYFFHKSRMSWKLFLAVTAILVLARFLNIFFMSCITNCKRTTNILTCKHKIVLWYSGFRGAMATALALSSTVTFNKEKEGDLFLILTLVTVGLNIFPQGICLQPLMETCGVIGEQEDSSMFQSEVGPPRKGCANSIKNFLTVLDEQILQEYLIIKPSKEDEMEQKGHQEHKQPLLGREIEMKVDPQHSQHGSHH